MSKSVAEKFPSVLDREGGGKISAQIEIGLEKAEMAGIKLRTEQCSFASATKGK